MDEYFHTFDLLKLSLNHQKNVHSLTQTNFSTPLSILEHCRQLTTWFNSSTLFALDQSSLIVEFAVFSTTNKRSQ